ncbi:hypothetical protein Mal64_37390 [Pseudobythopirellula maris]|uniref:Uncharacterized protein n=1 Tax=Pseudobythopirellula maris TaxID=2527991 RepID=A0A5C5ZHL8_9BACT|nr:AsmA-like C-terminal region-containing protein [Pseudobythopirellula maris]TWT86909.1 hypothetical protein Mal64_37390 [Pseudobythopirellula maris]
MFKGVIALGVAAALGLGAYLYLRLDEETRRIAEHSIAASFPDMAVRVGSARFVTGSGVVMYDVELAERVGAGGQRPVLVVEEVRLQGEFDVGSLLSGKPSVEHVVLKRPRLHAVRRPGGEWNFAAMKSTKEGDCAPRVTVTDATLLVEDEASPGKPPRVVQNVNLKVTPVTQKPGAPPSEHYRFEASADDVIAARLEASGEFDAASGALSVNAQAERFAISDSLIAWLPAAIPLGLAPSELRGLLDGGLSVSRPSSSAPLAWRANFRVSQGTIRHPRLGAPITDLSIEGACDNQRLSVARLEGLLGDTHFVAACNREGWSLFSPLAARCRVDGLDLDRLPRQGLPESAQRLLARFDPHGVVDVTASVAFDGARWRPEATIDCRRVSFRDAEKFDYRLTQGTGRLTVAPDETNAAQSVGPLGLPPCRLAADLTAQVEGRPVQIRAQLHGLGLPGPAVKPMPVGWITIDSESTPVTPAVLAALPEDKAKLVIESLHPRGWVDIHWRADRTGVDQAKPDIALDMRLRDCELSYDRFPYPLQHVDGDLRLRDDVWEFTDLESKDAAGRKLVSCHGGLAPKDDSHRLMLYFHGETIPLDERLRAALPEGVQTAWAGLLPRGQVDFAAHVSHLEGEPRPDIRVSLRPAGRSVSIEPAFSDRSARYRLDQVDGQFEWYNDALTMTEVRAVHGATSFRTNGAWQALPNGGWRLRFEGLSADRLAFNHDLMLAAPAGLRGVIERLKPVGGFGLSGGAFEAVQASNAAPQLTTSWDIGVDCHQANINAGLPIEGLCGTVRLRGSSDGRQVSTGGDFDFDSLFWNNVQLTEARGLLWADGAEFLIGEGAANKQRIAPAPAATAKAYGGELRLNARLEHAGRPKYGLAMTIEGADLARFASEYLQRQESLTGRVDGRLELRGDGPSIYGLEGRGEMTISDAQVYELPLMVSMLKVLRNRTPDATAFNRCESKFTLRGDVIEFQDLDLLGDAVSLYGRGEAKFDRELNLVFHSLVGRNELAIPVLRNFVGQASEQFWRVRVLGTTDKPDIRRETLPVVGNMLEQIQNDFQPSPRGAPGAAAPYTAGPAPARAAPTSPGNYVQ